nr:unnamed protein product [Callosobruchus analis]
MGEVSPSASRSHTIALMRFFSVDPDTEMNIQHTTSGIQVPDLADLWAREFILKIIQLAVGFICVGLYSEGLKILSDSISSMMFPNVVFSSFLIITGVIILSRLLGCHVPDLLTRIFGILGALLYLASAAVITYESLTRTATTKEDLRRIRCLATTGVLSYLNSSVICIISLILVELTEIYFARWVYDMVILGTGGYLLILSVMLLGMLIDELSPYVELSFLLAGAIFNLLGGILMFIR